MFEKNKTGDVRATYHSATLASLYVDFSVQFVLLYAGFLCDTFTGYNLKASPSRNI
jgi:hypothetical protein